MKNSARLIIPLLIILFSVAGCSLFRPQPSGTLFTFELEGKTYEIAGYVNELGESANYLTYRERDRIVFRAIDLNRIGAINRIVSGSISLTEANEIYQAGIQIAMEQDLFKNIDKDRSFEFRYGDYQLMVESYHKRADEFRNRFVVFDPYWNLKGIYWDEDSDGTIDRAESGDLEMDLVYDLYAIAIQRATEENRLDKRDDEQIIISKNKKRQKELAGVAY